jgi:hypothetical protein
MGDAERMTPLFKYFGSKYHMARHYPSPRPGDIVVEPFAGSACYSLFHKVKRAVLVELNADICALWRWLIRAEVRDVLALPVDIEIGSDIRDLDLSLGAKLLIRQWQRVGPMSGWTVSKWNGQPGLWCANNRKNVARSLDGIRDWQIIEGDYSLAPVFGAGTTTFVDSPYQHNHTYGMPRIDFAHLGAWCRARAGQVIVCEQTGADWLPFRPLVRVINRHSKPYGEIAWFSDEADLRRSPTTAQASLFGRSL